MAKWKIIRTCKYTEELEVEADSKGDAWEKSQGQDFDRIHDDTIEDEEVIKLD